MAVSLTQLSQEADRQRTMAHYPMDATYMPLPEHFHQHYQQPFPQQTYLPPPPPNHYNYQPFAHPHNPYADVLQERPPTPPPRPPKTPADGTSTFGQPPPLPKRPHSASVTSNIEPDPLPPHSNPQALTTTQSHAFESASLIPPVRLGKEEVWNSQTGYALYVITREAAHMPSFLSSKGLLNVTRTADTVPMGSIRFHSISTTSIDLTVNGRNTALSHSGFLHNRWGFASTTMPNQDEKWYWKKDKTAGGAKLEDSKKGGHVLARMKGDLLTFERRLGEISHEEVLLSAIAMAEAVRRQSKGKEVADLAGAIGDFAASDGGGGDGGGGDGGGGGA